MAVGAGKKRQLIQIPLTLALRIECLAEMDRRSMSNWILNLIEEHIEVLSEEEQDELETRFDAKLRALPPEKQREVVESDLANLQVSHPDLDKTVMDQWDKKTK